MSCRLCGGRLVANSQRIDNCRECGAWYIAFEVGKERGSFDRDWVGRATEDLEAAIGRLVFEKEFEASHQLEGLTGDNLTVIRIRALRKKFREMRDEGPDSDKTARGGATTGTA